MYSKPRGRTAAQFILNKLKGKRGKSGKIYLFPSVGRSGENLLPTKEGKIFPETVSN
jgi:hypothetical protein